MFQTGLRLQEQPILSCSPAWHMFVNACLERMLWQVAYMHLCLLLISTALAD